MIKKTASRLELLSTKMYYSYKSPSSLLESLYTALAALAGVVMAAAACVVATAFDRMVSRRSSSYLFFSARTPSPTPPSAPTPARGKAPPVSPPYPILLPCTILKVFVTLDPRFGIGVSRRHHKALSLGVERRHLVGKCAQKIGLRFGTVGCWVGDLGLFSTDNALHLTLYHQINSQLFIGCFCPTGRPIFLPAPISTTDLSR
jgi:hypothetical protein